MVIDFRERQYVSRYGTDTLGLAINIAGAPADPDGNSVTLTFVREGEVPVTIFSRTATRVGTGLYEVPLVSADTAEPGLYTLVWFFVTSGDDQEDRTYVEVGETAPAYDALSATMKEAVDAVWLRFADLFDSPGGGPNLQTYFQTHFTRQRMAQILRIGMGRLNTMAQPHQTYSVDPGGLEFPFDKWGALLETVTYVEAIKHLRRSYVEQPLFAGSGAVTRLDRRDYLDRWGMILADEEAMLVKQMEVFKIAHMGFGSGRVLVSGGVYGRYGPTRIAGSVAARPRYWTRFY